MIRTIVIYSIAIDQVSHSSNSKQGGIVVRMDVDGVTVDR